MKASLIILSLALPAMVNAQEVVKREYHPNGQLSSVQWSDGERIHHIRYHENGQVSEKGGFREGKPDGRWIQFDDQGQRICRVKFDRGVRTGSWVIRSLDGATTHRLHYRANSLTHAEQFDAHGALIAVRDDR